MALTVKDLENWQQQPDYRMERVDGAIIVRGHGQNCWSIGQRTDRTGDFDREPPSIGAS